MLLKEKEHNSGRIQVKQLYSLNTNLDFLGAVAELYTCYTHCAMHKQNLGYRHFSTPNLKTLVCDKGHLCEYFLHHRTAENYKN